MTQKQHATVPPATVAIRGLAKRFGGVFALRGVDLEIRHGEIHGLLGENGSGKSTLIKVLAGFHRPDAGELAVRGEPVSLPLAPGQFRSLGFDFVHQDLALVPALTVVENLRMAEIASPRHPFHISWRSARRQAKALFERYEFDCDPGAKVEELRPVERALLAIVRAVEGIHVNVTDHGGSGLLVLDEPTALLPKAGAEQLFSLVRNVASQGCSVLLVSHHLEEILEVTDRVTVLRDGSVVGTRDTPEVTGDELVELIIGRKLEASGGQPRRVANRSVVASVRGVRGELVNSVDLAVSEGEVLGLTGLVGSGFEELPYLIFGAWRAEAGELSLDGATWSLPAMTPQKAIEAKIALVPADRQHDGSLPSLPVTDNMTMMMLGRLFRGGLLRRREMERETRTLMEGFDVRPLDPTAVYSAFSGGNQQKALLAKWFHTHPKILMLHEPTQGVDVGAREQIFGLIRSAAAQGLAVICASADYEQLAAICNRVVVISRGRVLSELTGDEVATDRIAERCYTSMPMPISRDGLQASLDGGRTPAFRSSHTPLA